MSISYCRNIKWVGTSNLDVAEEIAGLTNQAVVNLDALPRSGISKTFGVQCGVEAGERQDTSREVHKEGARG